MTINFFLLIIILTSFYYNLKKLDVFHHAIEKWDGRTLIFDNSTTSLIDSFTKNNLSDSISKERR